MHRISYYQYLCKFVIRGFKLFLEFSWAYMWTGQNNK